MKKLLIGLTLISFISCKEVKLKSCDLTVYHKGQISGAALSEIQDELYYQKGWTVTTIKVDNYSEVDKTLAHATLDQKKMTKRNDSKTYNDYPISSAARWDSRFDKTATQYKFVCNTVANVSIPEIKKRYQLEYEGSKNTAYGSFYSDDLMYARSSFCAQSAVGIVKKVPKCNLK